MKQLLASALILPLISLRNKSFTTLLPYLVIIVQLWSQCVTQGVKFHEYLTNSKFGNIY